MSQVYTYPDLITGRLVSRYKRFFADIELENGEVITAHCANTGPMTGVCKLGSPVLVSYHPSPKRKLAYSWEAIYLDEQWIGINTSLPNRVIGHMLDRHLLPELEPYNTVKGEVAYGNEKSRIDFLLTNGEDSSQKTYVEVKNTTWCMGSLALFPDTVTTRGQKHIRELMSVLTEDTSAALIFFINRGDCDRFAAGAEADPEYARLLKEAIAKGVKVLPCRFAIEPPKITYLGLADLVD
ncbi:MULTISPECIES: DNA/RNA nuclease SfsA [Pseudanabaena]|jgi:sugar fermentation stimulation protein A|uniref:DNA/RNA nuclease SfsA n=1 Tax=Pseudanabaena TaxID=1152 RepID=UPI002478CAEA|nr:MULTISPECIES: DNA/RNA nuclease SfsA [Pseudanabaena]MEA5489798.1 DNA/RNA nuclease SfsA [Pseudanabaena sp. CCNP1317]WGS71067.1 DNA/RNA nuclease SfsA [Pseudanabaena galeata CCNP1313]